MLARLRGGTGMNTEQKLHRLTALCERLHSDDLVLVEQLCRELEYVTDRPPSFSGDATRWRELLQRISRAFAKGMSEEVRSGEARNALRLLWH